MSALGDDLDDGLAYEVDFAAGDAAEGVAAEAGAADGEAAGGAAAPKKRPASSKLQLKKRLKMEMDTERKRALLLELLPEAIAEWVNARVRQRNPSLLALELAERYLDKGVFRATGDFGEPRSLDRLSEFIKTKFGNMLPSAKAKTKADQRKFIAVLSMLALRACDVHRATRDLGGLLLKLINKNKIEVDLGMVGTTKARVLCCTPGRLEKVLTLKPKPKAPKPEAEAAAGKSEAGESESGESSSESEPGESEAPLKADEIKIVILDNSYLDQKRQNVWDIHETLAVLKRLTTAGARIYLY